MIEEIPWWRKMEAGDGYISKDCYLSVDTFWTVWLKYEEKIGSLAEMLQFGSWLIGGGHWYMTVGK